MEHLPFWKLSFPEEEWFVGKFFRYPLRAEPPSPGSWNDWHKLTACPANLSEFNICWHEEQVSPAASGFSSGLRFDVHYRNSSVALRYSCPGAACCNPTAQLVEKFMWLFALCFSAVSWLRLRSPSCQAEANGPWPPAQGCAKPAYIRLVTCLQLWFWPSLETWPNVFQSLLSPANRDEDEALA